jgi:preprotein translocase subunit YajC
MLHTVLLFAQDNAKNEGANPLLQFLPYILIIGLFMYLMLFLPARRERKQREALYSALKKNDKVVTSAGIIGVVSFISEKGDEVMLKLDEGKMRVLKSSIVRILTSETTPEAGKTP